MICMPVKKGKKSKKEVESILLDKTKQIKPIAVGSCLFLRTLKPPHCRCLAPSTQKALAVCVWDALWNASPTLLSGSVQDRLCSSGICNFTAEFTVWVYFHLLCGLLPFRLGFWEIVLSYFFLLCATLILFGTLIAWMLGLLSYLSSHFPILATRPPDSSILSFSFCFLRDFLTLFRNLSILSTSLG